MAMLSFCILHVIPKISKKVCQKQNRKIAMILRNERRTHHGKMRLTFVDLKKKGLPVDVTRGKCLPSVNSLRCNSHLYQEQIDFLNVHHGRSRRKIEKLMRAKMNVLEDS